MGVTGVRLCMSLGAYRQPVHVAATLAWHGDEPAARRELERERQSTLNIGACVIGALLVLAALASADTFILALTVLLGGGALAVATWLLTYGLSTHAPRVVELEGHLERGFSGDVRLRAGRRRYRLFPLALRPLAFRSVGAAPHANWLVRARVLPAFGAVIAWAHVP